jgi:transcriptional regulator with XRE-family HTH domain
MQQIGWVGAQLPTFETRKDGFPRPGQVTKYFRERKKRTDATWTQKRLARELGITEKAVRDSENRDVGFDSIALRRKVARWFDIPPLLLGLSSLEEESEPGQIIRCYRKMREKTDPLRTQVGLARALGITERAVRQMEKQNKGLDSISRRRVLTHLLKIPPVALGIVTLEDFLIQQQMAPGTLIATSASGKATFDLTLYNNRIKALGSHWANRNYTTGIAQEILTQITVDETSLNAALPYMKGSDEATARDMLCRYQQFRASILRDQGRYDAAIAALEKAFVLAERSENPHQLASTLLRFGHVLYDRGDVLLAQAKIEAARGNSAGANQKLMLARADYMAALDHFRRARGIEQLPSALNGVLLLDEGNIQAHLARGQRDASFAALALFKQGGKIIAGARDTLEDEFSIAISERDYRVRKALVLLAAGWTREALQELTDLMDLSPEEDMTSMKNAYNSYLWAQAYADLGWIDAAAAPAQDSLEVMKRVKSNVNITRIAGLQAQLSQIDHKNIEVIRLGVMLDS